MKETSTFDTARSSEQEPVIVKAPLNVDFVAGVRIVIFGAAASTRTPRPGWQVNTEARKIKQNNELIEKINRLQKRLRSHIISTNNHFF